MAVVSKRQMVFDFSAIKGLVDFYESPKATEKEALARLIGTTGFQTFLQQHRRKFDEERFGRELVELKHGLSKEDNKLQHWLPILQNGGALKTAVDYVRDREEELIDGVIKQAFPWLPLYYFQNIEVFFIIDGYSHGYCMGNHWICDLYPSLVLEDPEYNDVYVQLFHIVYGQELRAYLQEFWYQYGDKVKDSLLMYKLYILLELLKNGVAYFLLYYLGILKNPAQDLATDNHVEEISRIHGQFLEFMNGLKSSSDRRQYYRENVLPLYDGRFNGFQLLGAFMCRAILDNLDRHSLRRCISNPLELPGHFYRAMKKHKDGNLFSPPLPFETEYDTARISNMANQVIDYRLEKTGNGALAIGFSGGQDTEFCICFRNSGSLSDGGSRRGLSHLGEHYFANMIQQNIEGLSFLKGLTDRHNSMFCGTIKGTEGGRGGKRLITILDLLLHTMPDNENILAHIKKSILAEIQLVSKNPFYDTEKALCRLIVENDNLIRGEYEEISSLDLAAVRDFQKRQYIPANLIVVLAGSDSSAIVSEVRNFVISAANGRARPAKYPVERRKESPERISWKDSDHILTTCSFGFYGADFPFSHGLIEYFCRKIIEKYINRCLTKNPANADCTIFGEYKGYDDFGLAVINCQGFGDDITRIMHELADSLRALDADEELEYLRRLHHQRIKHFREIWADDRQELCLAAALEAASADVFDFSKLQSGEDPANEQLRRLPEILREAFNPINMYAAGSGPAPIKLDSI